MAGPGSQWTGPLSSGPIWNPGDARGPVNSGLAVLTQEVTITATGVAAAAITVPFSVPAGSQLLDWYADTTTAWNGTTAVLSIGASAGGTDYQTGATVATAGRFKPSGQTAAQLTAMLNVGNNTVIDPTITTTGTATTGSTTITFLYIQTIQLTAGEA
jgi:hypothetical protein